MAPLTNFFGRYEVLGELGRGTTGVVYEARDEALGRRVALKLPAVGASGERFYRECRTLAYLTGNPGCRIPALCEVGEHRGRAYCVRELVDGDTLERRAASIGLGTCLALLAEVARVVEWVHGQGFAHRNLSAANVLVARDLTPWLVGFGRVGLLAGSAHLPAGAAGTSTEVDVRGLRNLLHWLYGEMRQPIPAGLERATAPEAVATAGAFAAAVPDALGGGPG